MLLAAVVVSAAVIAGPASGATDPTVGEAVDWIATQQQSDGGFEVAGFPGFETADATLAIAEGGQTGPTWSPTEALTAVQAVTTAGGKDALDNLDDLADASTDAGQAAKLVLLVTAPLGLGATDFDPSADSAASVDLRARILAAAGTGDYGGLAFNARLYVAIALTLLGDPIPAALVSAVRAAQQANGGWSFSGNPGGADLDIDTTGLALQTLIAAGLPVADEGVRRGVRFLAGTQRPSGAWSAFGSDDPNSTALAVLGITATGGDVTNPCWRNNAELGFAGVPYLSPLAWLEDRQAPDGHIVSPNDEFGVNTLATSQSVQAIARRWLPVARSPGPPTCTVVAPEDRFVHAAFYDILDRLAFPTATAYYAGRVQGGEPRSFVARSLTGSSEYRTLTLNQIHLDFLDRLATPAEKAVYGPLLRDGHRRTVEASILASGEYYTAAGGTNPGFVDALYDDVLGRPADASGRAAFVAQLAGGRSRAQVASSMVASREGRSVQVKARYLEYLRRPVDSIAHTYWRDRLHAGTSIEALIISLVSSNEYFVKTQG
ncbi:MAG: DUF4214 domain-containing protein [Acidimicrobiales bacterium]